VRPPDLQQTYALAIENHQAGRLREAEEQYRRILVQRPDHADAMQMLGVLLGDMGNAAAGEELIRRAIAINPNAPQYHGNLGMILARQGRTSEAMVPYRRALSLYPQYPEAENNLALAMLQQGQIDEALAHFRRSVALRPQYEEAYIGLGNALLETGRLQETVASYRRAIVLSACSQAWHNLLFALHFDVSFDSKRLLEEHRRWAQLCADRFAPPRDGPGAVDSSTGRLRIGYVSPDLREHPVGWFLAPLLENRNHERFEAFCYADVANADATTARLKAASDVWRDTIRMTDEQLAGHIREDRIDILIDLAMHTGRRLLVFARKPAPVQASYLAYCSTTGLKTIDFRLTDPYLDTPQKAAEAYSEQSIFLPRTYWCYQPLALAPPVEPPPMRKSQVVTFGCLNSYRKVTDATLSLWSKLLSEVNSSHLLIHSPQGSHRQRVSDHFAAAGEDPARIRFVEPQPAGQYLATYHEIDVALDPLPYGGGTTTCDALWMGAPVVSLRGRTAVGRAGASILANVGLCDLIAETPERYIRIAAALAADTSRLIELRGTLRARMQASPLMDAPQFARDFEAALREMWRERGKQ